MNLRSDLFDRPAAWMLGSLCGVLLLAASAAYAVPEERFQSAFQRFKAAAAGDTAAIAPAAEAFTELLKAEPDNPVLLAYAGAATSMRARLATQPWQKMGFAEDGLAQIDKALALAGAGAPMKPLHGTPGKLEVKFISATTMLAMPKFLNRGARGAKLLDEVMASAEFAGAPVGFRGEVLLKAVELAVTQNRAADARRFTEQVVAMGAPQAESAQAKLREVAP